MKKYNINFSNEDLIKSYLDQVLLDWVKSKHPDVYLRYCKIVSDLITDES